MVELASSQVISNKISIVIVTMQGGGSGERPQAVNDLRGGERPQRWRTTSEVMNRRSGGCQPHADCPTEADAYRMVLTLQPSGNDDIIVGKKMQLT